VFSKPPDSKVNLSQEIIYNGGEEMGGEEMGLSIKSRKKRSRGNLSLFLFPLTVIRKRNKGVLVVP
jgi:hypothetical protein